MMRNYVLFVVLVICGGGLQAQDSIRDRFNELDAEVSKMFYSGDRVNDPVFRQNLSEAKSLARQLNDKQSLSRMLRMEGLYAANVLGNIDNGYSRIDSAFSISFQSKDSIGISKGHAAKANLFLYQNETEKALTHYLQALEFTNPENQLELFQAYYSLAYCYDRMEEMAEAEYFFNKVLSLRITDLKYLPKSIYYKMMADAYHHVDRYSDAEFFLDKFLAAPTEYLSSYDLMEVHFMKGAIENSREADDLAKAHYLTSIAYGNKIGDTILFPETEFNLGLTYSLMGEKDSAMYCLNHSIELFERANRKRDLFDAHTAMGDIFYNYQSYARADESYRTASALSYEIKDTVRILKGLSNLADSKYGMKAYKSSASNSRKILEFRNENVKDVGAYMVRAYMNIGDCSFEEGKFNTAYDFYEKALEEADSFNLEGRKALAYYNMAWVRMEQKKKVDAGILINKGFKIADKHGLNGTKKQLCEASNYLKYQMKYEGSLPNVCETF